MWCYTGEGEIANVLAQAHEVAEPIFEHVDPMPYPALQSMFDGLYPPGDEWDWKGDLVRDPTDEAIAAHERFAEVPTPQSTMHLYPIDGAVHDVAPDATAWSVRDVNWSMVIVGVSSDPADREAITDRATDHWEAVHPHTVGGAYVDFMMDEGAERIRGTYGDNYERLREVKTEYDPDNVFHANQNVPRAN